MVSHIRYVFRSSNLFDDTGEADLYDYFESVEKYANLCQQKLEQVYPGASVDIFTEEQNWEGNLTTQVDGDSSKQAIEAIDYICTEVYNTFAWLVSKNWFDLSQAASRFQLPVPILRWLCKEGIVKAKNFEGAWKVPATALTSGVDGLISRCPSPTRATSQPPVRFCDFEDIWRIELSDLSSTSKMLISTSDDFGNPLFSDTNSNLEISLAGDQVELVFEHFADRVPWTVDNWSYDAYVQALMLQAQQYKNVSVSRGELQYANRHHTESVQLTFTRKYCSQDTIQTVVEQAKGILEIIVQDTEVALRNGPTWRPEYENKGNEPMFCREVLEHLLHRMGFEYVRYIHGNDEYGRDFILAEQTKWGWSQYYGIQVKAGDINGGAKSQIDMILAQLEDAFTMPYRGQNAEEIYITAFVVAISGHFKKNAKEKIIEKIPRRDWRGSVRFLDQDDIRALIRKHWFTGFSIR